MAPSSMDFSSMEVAYQHFDDAVAECNRHKGLVETEEQNLRGGYGGPSADQFLAKVDKWQEHFDKVIAALARVRDVLKENKDTAVTQEDNNVGDVNNISVQLY
jgi:WXG100 family type VII secretion target